MMIKEKEPKNEVDVNTEKKDFTDWVFMQKINFQMSFSKKLIQVIENLQTTLNN